MTAWFRNGRGRATLASTGLSVCLFLIVAGCNWAINARYGSDMPDMDQYDAEGTHTLAPWLEGREFLRNLFAAHNEHRVVVTKLQNLAVVLAAGQWDARVECLFNALLHAALAVGLWWFGRRYARRGWQVLLYVTISALYALPLSWQNLLAGFHSQQYWLIGLSAFAIAVVPWATVSTLGWWLGMAAAVLALGTMGSGLLAAATVLTVALWRWLAGETRAVQCWATVLPCVAILALGLATRVVVPQHAVLKAGSASDFILCLIHSGAWPYVAHDWTALILWAPAACLLIVAVRRLIAAGRPIGLPRPALTLLALAGWIVVQLLATAYERGAGGAYPASRYMDTLIFGAALNALALAWLVGARRDPPATPTRRPFLGVLAVIWLTTLGVGLGWLARDNLTHALPAAAEYFREGESHLRSFLITDDRVELRQRLPYPNADQLAERLSHPALRRLMPSSVRPPLAMSPAGAGDGFLPNRASLAHWAEALRRGLNPATSPLPAETTWGSFGSHGAGDRGRWRSTPLAAPNTAWLRFEMAGDAGEPGVTLELQDAQTGRTLAVVAPTKTPGNAWRTAFVRSPARPFVVVATDESATRWMAFGPPTEMTAVSYWAWQLMKSGVTIATIAGAFVFVFASLSVEAQSRSDRARHSTRAPVSAQ